MTEQEEKEWQEYQDDLEQEQVAWEQAQERRFAEWLAFPGDRNG
jgi:hypothetical protein